VQRAGFPWYRPHPGHTHPPEDYPPGDPSPKRDSTTRAAIRIARYRQERAVPLANIFGPGDDPGSGHAVCSRRAVHEDTGRQAP
jgi:hypothetical protein